MTKERAIVEEMLTKPSSVVPTLFVGIGGCGCKIAVRVAQHLKKRPDYKERYSSLVKFALIDTNVNDLESYREHADESFLISNFEKEEYANLAGGKLFLEADDYFTQWVPQNYRFRAGDTAGAGQIRIESRLGSYYQVKHKGMVPRFRRLLEAMKDHSHGHRRLNTAEIRIVMCYSVAGGTGSGSFLPLAYMLRDQAKELGKPSLYGVTVMPAVFEDKTAANKDGTFANGYAALKEAEHLMKLGAPESSFYPEDGIEFHYDPSDPSKKRVYQQPFEFMYIIDRPESYSLEDPVEAAADGLYLQLFTPLFGVQAGDYDNYTQHQRFLVPYDFEGKGIVGYTQYYGSYGSAVLLVPVPGLVDYCARTAAIALMRMSFLGSIPGDKTYQALRANSSSFYEVTETDDPNAAPIKLGDFYKRDNQTQQRLRDRLFQKRVRLLAACEYQEGKSAQFMEIFRHGHTPGSYPKLDGAVGKDQELERRDQENLAQNGMAYSIGGLLLEAVAGDPWPGLARQANAKIKAEADNAKRTMAFEKGNDLGYWRSVVSANISRLTQAGKAIIEDGYTDHRTSTVIPGMRNLVELDFMREDAGEVNLAAQRYAALTVLDAIRSDMKEPPKPNPPQFDEDDSTRIKDEDRFKQIVSQLFDYEVAKAFYEAQMLFLELRATFRTNLTGLTRELRGLEQGFEEFARRQEKEVNRQREEGDESANQFVIDTEALQIENGRRMWDFYYWDKIANLSELSLQNKQVQSRLNGVIRMMSLQDSLGTGTKLQRIFDSLLDYTTGFLSVEIGGDPKSQDPARRDGQTLADALKLEAEYRALYRSNQEEIEAAGDKAIQNAIAQYRSMPKEEQIDLSAEVYQDYFRDKITRIQSEKAAMLCSFDESRSEHGGVRPNQIFLGLMSSDFNDPDIKQAIKSVRTAGITWVDEREGWHDPHKIVFYRAVLNVPLYVFGRMNEMGDYYHRFKNLARRSKVLHIDKNWENSLPDLDPDSAQERHRQERVRQHIINFGVLLTLKDRWGGNASYIIHRDGKYLLRPPHSLPDDEAAQYTELGETMTQAIERLPELLAAEKVKYLAFQQMLQAVQDGLAPLVLEHVVQLPFKWRKNRDQLRTQYGSEPSPVQQLKLKDYTDSYERMKEALESLLERLYAVQTEQTTIGGVMDSNSAGLPDDQAQSNLHQSIQILNSFIEGWRGMENPEESRSVAADFRDIFQPIAEGQLKATLDILRSGEIDRASFKQPAARTEPRPKPRPADSLSRPDDE